MSRGPASRGTAGAAAGAVALGSLALTPVFATTAWLTPTLLAVLAVGVGGVVVRSLVDRLGRTGTALGALAAPVVQLLALLAVLTVVFAPERALLGVLPTGASTADLGAVLGDGFTQIGEQVTPAPPLDGLVALTTLLVGVLALLVDLVAVLLRQPAVGGMPLLVLCCIPVATTTGEVSLLVFLGPALGLALLLWSDQRLRLAGRQRSGPGAFAGTGVLPALRTGALAVLAGLLLPALVPTLAEGSFAAGLGAGGGPGGSSTGTSLDPQAALRGQLTQPEPVDLLQVDTATTDPGYLRAVALDQYTAEGWGIGDLDGGGSTEDPAPLLPVPSGVPTREVTAEITALAHDDDFLPVFASPSSITVADADGADWRVDAAGGTVFGRDGARTGGRSWEVVAEEARPTDELLVAARALPADDPLQQQFTALPELDPRVTGLVDRLTDDDQTVDERVQAVFGYLTDEANGFVYDLSTLPGTTGDDLADFLDNRQGYCEQYAGAMAVLVRAAGVPARVVLGYTPGELRGDGTRVVTTADAHAWVEVFYAGTGWVTFDPTPISAARRVDLPWATRADSPAPDTGTTPSAAPTAAPAAPSADLGEEAPFVPLATPEAGAGQPWSTVAAVAGGTASALALLAAPALARTARRRRRLAAGTPEAVWDELLATATDLGVPVRTTGTPRQVGTDLAAAAGAGTAPAAAALAEALQASVYAPSSATGPDGAELARAARVIDRGLRRSARRQVRLRARLLPASTVADVRGWLLAHRPGRPRSA